MDSSHLGFFIIAGVVVFALFALFEIWYKSYDGFWDWWYSEINTDPKAGQWYYKSMKKRRDRLPPSQNKDWNE